MQFKKGTLWQRITETTERAFRTGALRSYPTKTAFIDSGGMRFFVRVLAGLKRKNEERKKQETVRGERSNPFLPPEQDLLVADVTGTHRAILNKFNVVDHHLLIITNDFEDQEELLTLRDLEALWTCMAEFEGLAFYNGGQEAGASQSHKHLQMVPLPLAPTGPAIPVEPLLAAAKGNAIPGFPFLHVFERFDRDILGSPAEAAQTSFDLYGKMLRSAGMEPPSRTDSRKQSRPYCFLATRDWMLLVPRSKEFFDDISFNALAFAGSFFVWNEDQLARLSSFGPMNALRSVTIAQE